MSKLGCVSLLAPPSALRASYSFSLKLSAALLLVFTILVSFVSLVGAADPTLAGRLNNNDNLDSQNLHRPYKGAGRFPPPLSSFASNPPNQLHQAQPASTLSNPAALNPHPKRLPDPSVAGSIAGYRSISDWFVADLILVSSIDGSLHALDRHTGLQVWEIPGDKPLVQVSTSEALKNRTKLHSLSSTAEPCEDCDIIWIVEPLGEGILYYFTPLTGLQQLPITIKELVMQSPFSLRGDDKIYIGSHSTTLYSIESSTGKILKAYGAGKSSIPNAACRTQRTPFSLKSDDDVDMQDEDDDDYDLELSEENGSFMIGRTGRFLFYFLTLEWLKLTLNRLHA